MNGYTGISSLQSSAYAGREVLLSWPHPTTPEGIHRHRAQLQQLHREGRRAWVLFDSVAEQTRFWLNFAEHTFHREESRETIQNQLRQWFVQSQAFNRIYLLAQENTEAPCYEITEYIQRCLAGDLSIAERLRGRTLFRLYQTETGTFDLLAEDGVNDLAQQILKGYIHEFADFLAPTIVGFCFNLPTFLSPLRSNPLSAPWSVQLIDRFQAIPEPKLLSYLPLLFYETYDSATVRSLFWERLTLQFAKVCVGGVRKFCHQWNLQLAVNVPATARALEIDIGTILNDADCPILSANQVEQPKQFLIAKLVTSRSGPISICRSGASMRPDADDLASDIAVGFNSWMYAVSREGEAPAEPQRRGDGAAGRGRVRLPSPPFIPPAGRGERLPAAVERLHRFLSIGIPRRAILILSPIHSLWTKPDPKTWNWMTSAWGWLCQTVWELGYDFDIASETELVGAEIDKTSRALCLKGAPYPVILLPVCLSLQEATVDRLTQFVKGRGKLIAVEPVPYLLNGKIGIEPYPLERLLYRWRTSILRGTECEKTAQLKRLLGRRIKPAIQVYIKPDNSPTNQIIIQHRQSAELDLFYLFNREKLPLETLIELRWEAQIEEWNTETGEQLALDYWHANSNTYITLSFARQQGRLMVARKNAS